jgi:hypothetical protein
MLFKRKKLEDEVELGIPFMSQDGQFDCRYEVFRSLDKYYNGSTLSVSALRTQFPNVEKSDSTMAKMYSSRNLSLYDITGDMSARTDTEIAETIISYFKDNKAVIVEFSINANGTKYLHNVGIKTVKTFSNGKVVVKVMNPSGEGGSRFTTFKDFTRFIVVSKF